MTYSRDLTVVRNASIADAVRLSSLAATTFRDTFEADNAPDDIERYVAEAFTPQQQATEISNPDSTILLAEQPGSAGGELLGYAHLLSGPAPAAVVGPALLELKRLYVAREWHGQGVAGTLMDAAWGRREPAAPGHSGSDLQTDWILVRSLDEMRA